MNQSYAVFIQRDACAFPSSRDFPNTTCKNVLKLLQTPIKPQSVGKKNVQTISGTIMFMSRLRVLNHKDHSWVQCKKDHSNKKEPNLHFIACWLKTDCFAFEGIGVHDILDSQRVLSSLEQSLALPRGEM